MHRLFLWALPVGALVLGPQVVVAQTALGGTPPGGVTPASCVTAATTYEREQYATRAKTGVTSAAIAAGKLATAKSCLATLALATLPDTSLPALARLYTIAGDTTTAAATLQRYLSTAGLTESERAHRYVAAIPALIGMRHEDALAHAEQLALGLDSMSSAQTALKVTGHGSLLSYYRGIDVDDKMELHAKRVMALAPSLSQEQRTTAANTLILAYTALAEVYGDRVQADQAIALLTRGETDLADLPNAAKQLASVRVRYELVGHAGAPIVAPYWLNAPQGMTTYTPTGNVTLLQFTAHWCGPCRKSYPAIARLQNSYGARGVKTVFVTNLYGFFKDQQHLTAEQEIDADREYFLKDHELPVQVAIVPEPEAKGGEEQPDANSSAYKVSGIPQIMLLDRAGVIRMIVIGWDPVSEARLAKTIETLLSEKAVAQR